MGGDLTDALPLCGIDLSQVIHVAVVLTWEHDFII